MDFILGERHVTNSIAFNNFDRLVGWPPVKTVRARKYVKVAVDGAAYLRKVDLQMYNNHDQLFAALENMFQGVVTICKVTTELEKNGEFMATYEDKDGDWMLVGDVPWMMFVESCKRMRLMKTADAMGLVLPS
nr:PREDICTED: auxin-responsive protein IAA15-like [Raphanus sativus]